MVIRRPRTVLLGVVDGILIFGLGDLTTLFSFSDNRFVVKVGVGVRNGTVRHRWVFIGIGQICTLGGRVR